MKGKSSRKWIQKAIKKKGSLRATAKRMGLIKGDEKLSQSDLEKLEAKGGKTARRARLARTLKKLSKRKRHKSWKIGFWNVAKKS